MSNLLHDREIVRWIQCPIEHRVDCHRGWHGAGFAHGNRFNARLSIVWIATEEPPVVTVTVGIQCPIEHRVDCHQAQVSPLEDWKRFNARLSIVWIATTTVGSIQYSSMNKCPL